MIHKDFIGWSTNIPSYNPAEIVANIRRLMKDEELVPMQPWWRGFTGQVIQTSKNKYDVTGVARKVDDTTIEITELPIHMWTKNFKEQLEAMLTSDKGEAPVKVSPSFSPFDKILMPSWSLELPRASCQRGYPFYYPDEPQGDGQGGRTGFDRVFQAENQSPCHEHDLLRL